MIIDKIEITDNDINLEILPKDNKVLIEGVYYPIERNTIEDLIRIIRNWDNYYYDEHGLDGVIFNIKVYYNNRIDEIKGIRKTPLNYREFSNLVRSIYDRR